MREQEFISFLDQQTSITSKDKAIKSRFSRARKVESDLGVNLDEVVKDDQGTYELLKRIKSEMNEHNGNYQNAVRKYYIFINNKEFPPLNSYISKNRSTTVLS